jgi:uncharacterized protein YndB with AHSA1/START domain
MRTNLLMNFSVDKANKKIKVEREFAAPVSKVWAAWTESKLLDQWWAPKPWASKTKEMDFKVGGHWLYAMVGPDGTEQWCRADYTSIKPLTKYSLQDAFCDKDGKIDTNFPRSTWTTEFKEEGNSTIVNVEVKYDKVEDLEKYMEMGFKEGFTAGLENLDELLDRQVGM